MNITLTRERLYEQVWSRPMIKVAKEYGISDNGLRKICAEAFGRRGVYDLAIEQRLDEMIESDHSEAARRAAEAARGRLNLERTSSTP